MEQSTRMALDRYRSVLLFMSFIKELVMMMTSSAPGQTSLITRYTIRLRFASLLWYSFVTLKKTSDASFCIHHNTLIRCKQQSSPGKAGDNLMPIKSNENSGGHLCQSLPLSKEIEKLGDNL